MRGLKKWGSISRNRKGKLAVRISDSNLTEKGLMRSRERGENRLRKGWKKGKKVTLLQGSLGDPAAVKMVRKNAPSKQLLPICYI